MATISSLLADHVSLQVRSVDRLFLQGYVPRLQSEGLVVRFLLDRGFPIPSPAVLGKIGRGYVDEINAFIADNQIPTVHFTKGDVKEEIAREHFQRAEQEGRFGVVMVGIAQEKTSVWRGWRDGGPDGHPHFVYRRQSIFPNSYYFYIRDPDWGPGFIRGTAHISPKGVIGPLGAAIYRRGGGRELVCGLLRSGACRSGSFRAVRGREARARLRGRCRRARAWSRTCA